MDREFTGSCECRTITFTVSGPLRRVIACHCSQCRKFSGHYWAATQARNDDLEVHGDSLVWYRSSDAAERGFCGRCGSSLFWRRDGSAQTSIAPGAIDGPTGLQIERHIYVADKGDYYALDDDLPKSDAAQHDP